MKKEKNIIIIKVLSRFHLYGAFSYIIDKELINYDNDILIVSEPMPGTNLYRVDENDVSILKNSNISFVKIPDIRYEKIKTYKSITVINPLSIPYKFLIKIFKAGNLKKIRIIEVDEGIGTIRSKKDWKEIRLQQYKGIKKAVASIYDSFKYLCFLVLKLIMIRKESSYFLFTIENDVIVPKQNVLSSYQKYFLLTKNIEYEILKTENNIIIVSDLLYAYLKSPEDEVKVYNMVIEKIKRKHPNATIYIKPHPREVNSFFDKNRQKINCELILENISAENLFNNNSIECVYGFCSTSLLTSSLFFNIPSISLVDCLPTDCINPDRLDFIKQYKKLVSKIPLLYTSISYDSV